MSLTQVSFYLRKFAPLGIVISVFVFFFFIFLRILISMSASKPVPVSNINLLFNKISAPVYAPSASSSAYPQSFLLDNIEGRPVTATDSAKIFFLPPSTTNLVYRDKIYLMAKTFGFSPDIKHTLKEKEAQFVDGKQTLSVNIADFNFSYRYEASLEAALFVQTGTVPSEAQSVQRAGDFLRSLGRYPAEFSRAKTKTIYLVYRPVGNTLAVVDKPEKANVVEVDFYRPDIGTADNGSIVTPGYFNSQNYVVMAVNKDETHVIRAQMKFYEKSDDQVGVYPVRTGDDAWEQLRTGKGHIVSTGLSPTSVTIKKMYVAYLDPDIYQEYLQPVYVFLGDQGFVGYVPAVRSEFLLP